MFALTVAVGHVTSWYWLCFAHGSGSLNPNWKAPSCQVSHLTIEHHLLPVSTAPAFSGAIPTSAAGEWRLWRRWTTLWHAIFSSLAGRYAFFSSRGRERSHVSHTSCYQKPVCCSFKALCLMRMTKQGFGVDGAGLCVLASSAGFQGGFLLSLTY